MAGAGNGITLSGNFSTQQTNPLSWTYGGTPGLGPDLTMTGGTSSLPTTLEVGGVNLGNIPAGFVSNFALNSLTIGSTSYVALVDTYSNAGTAGSEALYLNGLFGTSMTAYGTLNLEGIYAYLAGYGQLMDGLFTDANGDLVNITGAPISSAVPEPSTWAMMTIGFLGLGFAFRSKRRKVSFA